MQRAALDFLWGGGWQELVLERGAASNATAGNATAGGVAGLTLKPVAFPQNRALNARFAGGLLPRQHSASSCWQLHPQWTCCCSASLHRCFVMDVPTRLLPQHHSTVHKMSLTAAQNSSNWTHTEDGGTAARPGPDLSEWACLGVGYFMLAWAAFTGIWALASWRLLWQARRRLDRAGGDPLNGRGWVQIPAVGGFFIAIAMAADVWHHIAASMGALHFVSFGLPPLAFVISMALRTACKRADTQITQPQQGDGAIVKPMRVRRMCDLLCCSAV